MTFQTVHVFKIPEEVDATKKSAHEPFESCSWDRVKDALGPLGVTFQSSGDDYLLKIPSDKIVCIPRPGCVRVGSIVFITTGQNQLKDKVLAAMVKFVPTTLEMMSGVKIKTILVLGDFHSGVIENWHTNRTVRIEDAYIISKCCPNCQDCSKKSLYMTGDGGFANMFGFPMSMGGDQTYCEKELVVSSANQKTIAHQLSTNKAMVGGSMDDTNSKERDTMIARDESPTEVSKSITSTC